MEVTQSSEHVTHALVGSRETIDMGVAETAAFFTMMSSTLYSDQKLACVREIICNAWDAHIDSNRTDTPLEITLTEDQMIIRDFGYGIPHNMIGPIYGVYGQSTKAKDEKSTGGFGLGSKAPFAYTEHFRVISAHEGIRTVYQMSKSSSEVEGKPSIDVIVSTPTNDTGLTVIIDIDSTDYLSFKQLISGVVANGDMLADLNGERLDTLPFNKAQHGFLLTNSKPLDAMGIVNIRYGTVVYPLEQSPEIADDFEKVAAFMSAINHNIGYLGQEREQQLRLILQAPPNTITVTPSRETLSMQKRTIETVRKLLNDFNKLLLDKIEPACDPIIKESTYSFFEKHPELAIPKRSDIEDVIFDYLDQGDQYNEDNKTHIFTTTSVAKQLVSRRKRLNPKQHKTLYLQLLKTLMPQLEPGMLGAAQALYREARRAHPSRISGHSAYIKDRTSWLKQHITSPLIVAMKTAGLSPNNLWLHDEVFNNWRRCRKEKVKEKFERNVFKDTSMSYLESLPYLDPVIVITHNQRDLNDSMKELLRNKRITGHPGDFSRLKQSIRNNRPFFFYVVSRNAESVNEVKEFFAKTPFTVYDVTPHQLMSTVRHTTHNKSTTPRVNRRAGYARLDGMKQDGELNILFTQTDDAPRIKEPSFFVPFDIKREKDTLSVPGLSTSVGHYLIDNYGTEGALAVTTRQQEKCREAGIPHMKTFLAHKFYDQVMQNKAVLQYLANTHYRKNGLIDALDYNESRVLKMILGDHVLAKKHGINLPDLSGDELLLARRWEEYMHYMRNCEEAHKAYHAKLKPSKRLIKLAQLVNENSVIDVLDTYTIQHYLTCSNTDLNKLARYILTTLLRKGINSDESN